jgi:ABC-2 type transport system ATP-binding protein
LALGVAGYIHRVTSTPARSPAIQTRALSRTYAALVAVQDLTFEVEQGAIFGLLGPNGAGKSTTIKMLTTLLPPSSGAAVVAGYDIVRQPADVRRRIGYVPQLVSADGGLTGRENLALSAKLYRVPRAERGRRIREALTFMDLEVAANHLVRTYSGGMIRRLELAQAMLHEPAVLFLDEPTIGLDPMARRAVWERLLELRRGSGMTMLLTTHDMEEADALCDRLAIMHQGALAVAGRPADLKAALGENATLEDVFIQAVGGAIEEGGTYRDVRRLRSTVRRLG